MNNDDKYEQLWQRVNDVHRHIINNRLDTGKRSSDHMGSRRLMETVVKLGFVRKKCCAVANLAGTVAAVGVPVGNADLVVVFTDVRSTTGNSWRQSPPTIFSAIVRVSPTTAWYLFIDGQPTAAVLESAHEVVDKIAAQIDGY